MTKYKVTKTPIQARCLEPSITLKTGEIIEGIKTVCNGHDSILIEEIIKGDSFIPVGMYYLIDAFEEITNMTKEEALKKIEELKRFVEQCDKKKQEISSSVNLGSFDLYSNNNRDICISNVWAYTQFKTESQGKNYQGSELSGHNAMLFLSNCFGTWYDQHGNRISGYLYFKPMRE